MVERTFPPGTRSSSTVSARAGTAPAATNAAARSRALMGEVYPRAALPAGSPLEAIEELGVGLRLPELLDEELHGLLGLHLREHAAEDPGPLEDVRREELLLLARARGGEVDGREDAPVGQLAGQHDLGVPRALELLEDDLVHAAAR